MRYNAAIKNDDLRSYLLMKIFGNIYQTFKKKSEKVYTEIYTLDKLSVLGL